MIRTQVYLTEQQATAIKRRSKQERKPQAEVIRELVDGGLRQYAPQRGRSAGDALLALVALGKKYHASGPTDLSTNHDDYLYGDKK